MNPTPDHNWVTVEIPGWQPDAVAAWLRETRRLFGLHPFLRIDHWEARPDDRLQPGWHCRFTAWNALNGVTATRTMQAEPLPDGWRMTFDTGWLAALEWRWEPHGNHGTALTCTEIYHPEPTTDPERNTRLLESRSGLLPWSLAIRRHLRWRRFLRGWTLGGRLLDRFARLCPAHRRLARLLLWSSLLELALLFLGLLLWRLGGG